jgi:hypothetical protein
MLAGREVSEETVRRLMAGRGPVDVGADEVRTAIRVNEACAEQERQALAEQRAELEAIERGDHGPYLDEAPGLWR